MLARNLVCLLSLAAALAACGGGGDGEGGSDGNPTPSTPPGGLYVGYYQEDPTTNPEDPMPGAYSLNLPAGNGDFSGSMYFTYVGCQSSNVGTVGGTKNDLSLSGQWSGPVDGLLQSGTYVGTYHASTQSYSGTYANDGGKQYRDLRPCIQYTIAPNGTWEMFPVEARVPASFGIDVAGRSISWSATTGAASALVYVLDPLIAQGAGNPVVWQAVVNPNAAVTIPINVPLQSGKQYIAVVGLSNGAHERLAFSSLRFTQP